MTLMATLALAGLRVAGSDDAMLVAPRSTLSVRVPIVDAAVVVVTKTVRRGPMGRRVVTIRGVVR